MSMTPSDNWYTNNVDKIIEIVGDAETMEFNQLDFDRVERELFSISYDEIFKELAQVKGKLDELQKDEDGLSRDYHFMTVEFVKMEKELAQVKKENELRKEALEFYADRDNWKKQNQYNFTICNGSDKELSLVSNSSFGGKRARKCEEKIKEGK